MNAEHQDLLDDVAVYALGTLPAADSQRVRNHIETCDECRAEYEALSPAIMAVAVSAEAAASPLLKARIMSEVRGTTPIRSRAPWTAYLAAAACLALAIGSMLYAVSINGRLQNAESRLALQAERTHQDDAMIADLSNGGAQRVAVRGGEVVRYQGRVYLALHDLPNAPAGKVYQAWTLPKGSKTMVPSITFVPDSRGVALVPVTTSGANAVAVAVSVEPPGGSKQPTSAPVLLAHLE